MEEETERRKRLGVPFGDSILSYSLGLIKFIMGRELQNGCGEIFFNFIYPDISKGIRND